MDNPEKKRFLFNKLGNIEKTLYTRGADQKTQPQFDQTPSSTPQTSDVPVEWTEESTSPRRAVDKMMKFITIKGSMFKTILLIAIGFFLVSAAFGAYVFFGGVNRVSTENVSISITGPSSIAAGDPLSFDFSINNRNNVALEGVNLLIEYPFGTRTVGEERAELARESEAIGTIPTGGIVQRSKQAVLFGEADTSERIIVSVEYRVKDSSATYFKEQNYEVIISTSPVRMTVNAIKETVSGNEIELSVEVVSNSVSVVKGLMLQVDYPLGFEFSTASPAPTYGNSIFLIGDLQPADRRVFLIKGSVSGQEGEERLFRISLGLPDKRDSRRVGTVYLASTHSVAIKRPFVSASLSLDGSSTEIYNAEAGHSVQGEIAWSNNLPSRIVDLEIQVKLSGAALNRFSIKASRGGFYRSLDDVVFWDKTTSSNFAVVEPGESGLVGFSFASLPASSLLYSGAHGNEIAIELSVRARRLSDTNVAEQIASGASKTVRISSTVSLSGRSLYYTGAFANQGPVPPQVEQNTTYTIMWSVTNTLNDASGMRVEAVLPHYVSWLGNVSPGESIMFDEVTRRVIWDIGEVSAGTGVGGFPREAAFQVSFVPSISQINNTPPLMGIAALSGVDRFNSAPLRASAPAITTQVSDDPSHSDSIGRVQP